MNKSIKIFVGKVIQPSNGNWYDLSNDKDNKDLDFLLETNDGELIVSDIESDFDIYSEYETINFYREFQDLIINKLNDNEVKILLSLTKTKFLKGDIGENIDEIINTVKAYNLFETKYFDINNNNVSAESLFVDHLINNENILGYEVKNVYNSINGHLINDEIILRDFGINNDYVSYVDEINNTIYFAYRIY